MQFPESWLRTFCNPPLNTNELAETLTMAGLEVEELQSVAPPFSHVVVGEIKEAKQHPNADRLRVCLVDVGQSSLLNIVCGAPNARVGMKVPCALVGAQLPPAKEGDEPFVIKLGQLRGVESQGMLCSARELKISEDSAGLLELPLDAPIGQNIRDYLDLDDTLFTLKLTPNLAHCLSVFGVARELSALTGSPLIKPSFPTLAVQHSEKLPVDVQSPDLCGRFGGRIIKNVNHQAKTPKWMVNRLARCGQRSVSALVDISNYVMFELGRPSHIFDLDKIVYDEHQNKGLEIRFGRKGETLKLLNGNTVEVDEQVGVIANNGQIESLAGIMGGDASAVSDSTRDIYVEAAFWWPQAIAGRSRRFNFSTDAGHRFERGVDFESIPEHIERISELIVQICGGEVGPIDDQRIHLPVPQPIVLRVSRVEKILGLSLSQAECMKILRRLGLNVETLKIDLDNPTHQQGVLQVKAPSYRFDINLEEDLIEEIARLVGYNQLPTTPPKAPITPKWFPESQRSAFAVRRLLANLGYQETINFSFVDANWEHELADNPNPIQLLNPIASQMSVMRSSIMGSLLQVLKFNVDRKASRVRIFEIGRVFLRDALVEDSLTTVAGFHQPMKVAGLAFGAVSELQWGESDKNIDFFDVKGDVETLFAPICNEHMQFVRTEHPALHPGRSAAIEIKGNRVGFVGELHPKWRQKWGFNHAPVLFELDLDHVLMRSIPEFKAVSRLQAVTRDLAIVVSEEIAFETVRASILRAPTQGILRDCTLFDVYHLEKTKETEKTMEKPIEKSLAIRLTLHSDAQTLTDEQIESCVQSVLQQLSTDLNAQLRA